MDDGMTGAYHAPKYWLCRVVLATRGAYHAPKYWLCRVVLATHAAVDCSGTLTVAVGPDCSDDIQTSSAAQYLRQSLLETVVHAVCLAVVK